MKDYHEMAESVLERRDQYNANRKAAMNQFKKGMTGAACCCMAVLLGIGVFSVSSNKTPKADTPTTEAMKTSQQDMPQTGVQDFAANHENEFPTTDLPSAIDMPVTELPGSTGALVAIDEVWGGSYLSEEGRWVIWLTENTAQNQNEIFKLNPTLTEENTVFKTAAYSQSYLTNLLADISRAMGNKELPFVSTAILREELNRIEVGVTTDDAGSIEQIMSFDTIGGAIEIRHSAGQTTSEELVNGSAK